MNDDPAMPGVPAQRAEDVLVYQNEVFINFNNGTYQWVSIKLFQLSDPLLDDEVLLALLLSHGRYRDDYAGSGDNLPTPLHGPYWLCHITTDAFTPADPAAEETTLGAWAEEHAPLPDTARASMARELYPRLRGATSRYRLDDLGQSAFHEYGWVLGVFHELVLIDRAAAVLALVVACDD